jgi:hypothetical protein
MTSTCTSQTPRLNYRILAYVLPSVTPCGHAFSGEGLHGYFRNAVIQELRGLPFFYRHITDEYLSNQPFNRAFLQDLRDRTTLLKPRFECGNCRQKMSGPPVKCSAFSDLGGRLKKLAEAVLDEQDDEISFECDMSDYFIFHAHNPLAL